MIVGLVLAGFVLAKLRGRNPGAALAGAGLGAGAPLDLDGSVLEPELYSALTDPVGPAFEYVSPAETHGSPGSTATSGDPESDPWANAPTITVHVEQIEPREE